LIWSWSPDSPSYLLPQLLERGRWSLVPPQQELVFVVPEYMKILFRCHTTCWVAAALLLHHSAELLQSLPSQYAFSHPWASSNNDPPSAPDLCKRYTWFHNSLSYAAYCTWRILAVLHCTSDRWWPCDLLLDRFGILLTHWKRMQVLELAHFP